jgi:hypothetical protein
MTSQLTVRNNAGTALVEVGFPDPYEALAANLSQPGMSGTPLKFSKGRWFSGRGNEELDVGGQQLVADLDNLMTGWRRWWEQRITDQVVGVVAENFKPPQRNDLGDLDDSKWERDPTGKPKDPWQFGFFLRLVDPETDEAFAWSATSHGAKRAVGDLVKAFTRRRKKHPAECIPLIRLSTDFYKHQAYGRVDTPLLEIVGWRASETAPSLPASDGSDDTDMNDSIPF